MWINPSSASSLRNAVLLPAMISSFSISSQPILPRRSSLRHPGLPQGCEKPPLGTPSAALANSTSMPSPVRPDDAAVMLGDLRTEELAERCLEGLESAFPRPPHQPRISRD